MIHICCVTLSIFFSFIDNVRISPLFTLKTITFACTRQYLPISVNTMSLWRPQHTRHHVIKIPAFCIYTQALDQKPCVDILEGLVEGGEGIITANAVQYEFTLKKILSVAQYKVRYETSLSKIKDKISFDDKKKETRKICLFM